MNAVRIFEVGPRDGLQNETMVLSVADRVWLCSALVACGLTDIEAGAFVRADRVPQMAHSDKVQESLLKMHGGNPHFWYLVPNQKGLDRAIQCGVKRFAVFTAVSNTFNLKNIGMTVDDSIAETGELARAIQQLKKSDSEIQTRAYLSTVWGCPFEGKISVNQAAAVIEKLIEQDWDQLSMGDTIGVATPTAVETLFANIEKRWGRDWIKKSAAHFHDTRGTALANAWAAYQSGIRIFDSSIGGLGGCPFAQGATGNLSTEDLLYFFKEQGISTGVDYSKLARVSIELSRRMANRPLNSRALQAFIANADKKNPWDSSS